MHGCFILQKMNEDNNIQDHKNLNGNAGNFNNAGNSNPFKPGEDYFENFQNKIMFRVEEFEELKIEAPVLSNIPKYNPFEVPADYFDELPTAIQEKCTIRNLKLTWKEWLAMIFRPNFAIPVLSVFLIAFSAIYYLQKNQMEIEPFVAEEINIEEQLQNIDESTIIDALAAQVNNETSIDTDQDKIMNYLLENDIDETNLN